MEQEKIIYALKDAKAQIICLHPAGDPRKLEPLDMQDRVQIAVLDEIDSILKDLGQ